MQEKEKVNSLQGKTAEQKPQKNIEELLRKLREIKLRNKGEAPMSHEEYWELVKSSPRCVVLEDDEVPKALAFSKE